MMKYIIFLLLKGTTQEQEELQSSTENSLRCGEHVAAFWLQDDGTYSWYLGNLIHQCHFH